jgi:hypothetical protein
MQLVVRKPKLVARSSKLAAPTKDLSENEVSWYKNFAYTFADSFLTKPDLYRELLLTTARENIH